MKSMVGIAGLASALMLLATSFAQVEMQGGSAPLERDAAVQGTARGVVSSVDRARGVVTIHTAGGLMSFQATPGQLVGVLPGERFVARYDQLGTQKWLVNEASGDLGEAARSGQVSGTVESVHKIQGTVRIATSGSRFWDFKAHPDALERLLPGQWVTVEFRRVGAVYWVEALRGSGGSGGARVSENRRRRGFQGR